MVASIAKALNLGRTWWSLGASLVLLPPASVVRSAGRLENEVSVSSLPVPNISYAQEPADEDFLFVLSHCWSDKYTLAFCLGRKETSCLN